MEETEITQPQTKEKKDALNVSLDLKTIYYILGAIFIIIAFIFIIGIGNLDFDSIVEKASARRPSEEAIKSVLMNLFRNGFFGIFWTLLGCTSIIMGKLTSMKEKKE